MRTLVARHYLDGHSIRIEFDGAEVRCFESLAIQEPTDLILAPRLVDLQINGRQGIDFLDPKLEPMQVGQLAAGLMRDGVGAALATVTTQSFERISNALRTIRLAREQDKTTERTLVGIHLEGPYLSPLDGPRGAHPLSEIRPPSLDEFARWQDIAGGLIRLVTLAPEHPGSNEFIQALTSQGVIVALGHTSASHDQIRQAVEAGASMSTHLGNGAHGQLPRHPNYLWSQLADDRLTASLIADGHHLPDEVLRCFVRCKGAQRIVAVSDMTGLGGMPPGRYEQTALGAVEVLDNGRLVVAGQRQYLAGAALPLWRAIPKLACATDLDLIQAIEACSVRPASLLRLDQRLRLDSGPLDGIVLRQSGTAIELLGGIAAGWWVEPLV